MDAKLKFAAALVAMALIAPEHVSAAAVSPCKGLDQTTCQGNKICSWVRAHKTSKGRDVSAFCRKKPEKKETKAETAPKS
jgi:hypothetical protein